MSSTRQDKDKTNTMNISSKMTDTTTNIKMHYKGTDFAVVIARTDPTDEAQIHPMRGFPDGMAAMVLHHNGAESTVGYLNTIYGNLAVGELVAQTWETMDEVIHDLSCAGMTQA